MREVREVTGLVVHELGPMAVSREHVIPAFAEPVVMTAFEVADWSGEIRFEDDPDGDVCECVLVPPVVVVGEPA